MRIGKNLNLKTKIGISFGFLFLLFSVFFFYFSVKFIRLSVLPVSGVNPYYTEEFLIFKSLELFLFYITSAILIGGFFHFVRQSTDELEKKAGISDRAKNEFVSMASHQLRTPLANVNWYTEMLLAGDAGKLNKNQHKYMQEVYNSNQRMVELVNALLNVDLGSFAVEPELIDVREIYDSALSELTPQTENKNLIIEKKYEKNLPTIKADPRLLRIIFQNLLSNSIKYTPEGGRIKISVHKDKLHMIVSIADNGYGIPKDQQPRIFTRLFRADNVVQKSEGTGLGLYIVKAVMDQTGGKVWFESEEGKGTTFFVALPLKGMKRKKGIHPLNR